MIDKDSSVKAITVQTLLYESDLASITKFFDCFVACQIPSGYKLILQVGDCSRQPMLSETNIATWAKALGKKDIEFKYYFFNQNLGFAKGHNFLYRETAQCDLLLILNPDAVFPYHLITRLVNFADTNSDFGLVEARQIPLEHPKEFNLTTGEVDWASGACTLIKSQAFKECNGFDEIFFMYCEDVDLSWRIRANGYKIYYCINTFIYHSKHMTTGGMEQSTAEKYHGPLSAMLLRAKYGRSSLNAPALEWLKNNDEVLYSKLVKDYYSLDKVLQPATPEQKKVAFFGKDGNFATHRWVY